MSLRESCSIRIARREDTGVLSRFIRALGAFEGLEDLLTFREEELERELFDRCLLGAAVAECRKADSAPDSAYPVGFALWYYTYSTFRGQRGLFLEDLFVLPEARGQGLGSALLDWVADYAREQGCFRMDWGVLSWNEDAKRVYRGFGAEPVAAWEWWRKALNP